MFRASPRTNQGDMRRIFVRGKTFRTRWIGIVKRLRVLADDFINPFLASAWLQYAFLEIHPFADGNGRVSRIISSIPLLKAGLPPVYVSLQDKDQYFNALDKAYELGDFAPLAIHMMEEMEAALKELEDLAEDSGIEFIDTTARASDDKGEEEGTMLSPTWPASSLEEAITAAKEGAWFMKVIR
ncbi:hypothetical protein HDV00_001786 [Rhizophlyctis rosea]|nr:hypothetical protein HDV00_001786 [Rhizophlyctis rosea]